MMINKMWLLKIWWLIKSDDWQYDDWQNVMIDKNEWWWLLFYFAKRRPFCLLISVLWTTCQPITKYILMFLFPHIMTNSHMQTIFHHTMNVWIHLWEAIYFPQLIRKLLEHFKWNFKCVFFWIKLLLFILLLLNDETHLSELMKTVDFTKLFSFCFYKIYWKWVIYNLIKTVQLIVRHYRNTVKLNR